MIIISMVFIVCKGERNDSRRMREVLELQEALNFSDIYPDVGCLDNAGAIF